ncbi:MAG: Maf family nucleotide pyrophosphatase [Betaproteobacteria bacterium]|nr:Maf family nucleotide pyrophosphatase [Betaproteobacteria bacterium]
MITNQTRSIYLASRSPRRRDLLSQIGVRFQMLLFRSQPEAHVDVNEDVLPDEVPAAYVERLARAKAELGWQRIVQRNLPRYPVLGADTTVAVGGRILGKPASRGEAAEMLAALSGRKHEVLTAIALKSEERIECRVSRTEVEFRTVAGDEIREYVATGEADDKAGGYAIQGRAAQFVIALHGSYSGVMGLPLYETAQLLEKFSATRERRHSH